MDPRYPIGNFEMTGEVTPARRQQAIEEIAATPAKLRAAVKGWNDASSTRHTAKAAGPCAKLFITCRTAI